MGGDCHRVVQGRAQAARVNGHGLRQGKLASSEQRHLALKVLVAAVQVMRNTRHNMGQSHALGRMRCGGRVQRLRALGFRRPMALLANNRWRRALTLPQSQHRRWRGTPPSHGRAYAPAADCVRHAAACAQVADVSTAAGARQRARRGLPLSHNQPSTPSWCSFHCL